MSVQAPPTPTGSFDDYVSRAPGDATVTAGQRQKVELFAKDVSIGWLGSNADQWCVVTSEAAAVSLETYIWQNVLYYRNADDTSRYLSVSDGWHYVGFYNWLGARGWTLKGDTLISEYTNAQLSYWSSEDNYVYANSGDGFTPLTVAFH